MPLSTLSGGSLARSLDVAEVATGACRSRRRALSADDNYDDADDADLMLIQLELPLPLTLILPQFSLVVSSLSDDARKCTSTDDDDKNRRIFSLSSIKSFKPARFERV